MPRSPCLSDRDPSDRRCRTGCSKTNSSTIDEKTAAMTDVRNHHTLASRLERIRACAERADREEIYLNLLHAYIACLSIDELCKAAFTALTWPTKSLLAIRSRLVRIGRECSPQPPPFDMLAADLLKSGDTIPKVRPRTDAMLSHLYTFFSAPVRQVILDNWRDRGSIGAGARWLKAIESDEMFFAPRLVLDYWHQTYDLRAAKVLVRRGEPNMLSELIPSLIETNADGWIVSRAVLGASDVSDDLWQAIRSEYPATFAYLHAKMGRRLNAEDAHAIVLEASAGDFGDRGLAIWAVGQMGLWSALERIEADAIRDMDLKRYAIEQ